MADFKVTDEMVELFKLNHDPANELEQPDIRAGIAAVLAVVRRDLNAGWLIWSRYHQAWWKADEAGYTGDMMCAGRYDQAEALRLAGVRKMDDGSPGEVVVRAPEVELIGHRDLVLKMHAAINAATHVKAVG